MSETQFQVIRAEKLHSAAKVSYRLSHAMRDHVPENASQDLQKENRYFLPGVKDSGKLEPEDRFSRAMAMYRKNLPEKFRKDATTCVEFVVTGSHDRMMELSREDQEKYLSQASAWVVNRMGGKANLIAVSFHFDEKTPHASIFVTPLVNGRLNAKGLLGNSADLSVMQTGFNQDVAKNFGFERGVKYSKAKHTGVGEFYAIGSVAMKYSQELTKYMGQKNRVDNLYEATRKPSRGLNDLKAYDEAKNLLWAQERALEKVREKMTPADWSILEASKTQARRDQTKSR